MLAMSPVHNMYIGVSVSCAMAQLWLEVRCPLDIMLWTVINGKPTFHRRAKIATVHLYSMVI